MRGPAIAIDTQLMYGTPTGIGEYLSGLIPALRAQGVEFAELAQPSFDPWRFDRRFIWDQCMLPLRARKYSILHCTSGTMPFVGFSGSVIATVHDVAWLRVQQHARWYARAYFGDAMLRAYRRARAIITVSQFSRDELLSFAGFDPEKIHVIYPGVASEYFKLMRTAEQPKDQAPFILAVGTVERRKNLALAIRALALMDDKRAHLVSCGPPTPYLDECKALARQLGIAERVHFRGYVQRSELLQLYAAASAAVVPSFYEGFGLAAAQAVVAGLPLLVARTSSLTEIAGPNVCALELDDLQRWAEALDAVLANSQIAQTHADRIRADVGQRFSWEQNARSTAARYSDLLRLDTSRNQ